MNEEWRNELVTKGAVFDAQEVYMAIRPLDGYEDGLAMLDILRNLPSAQPKKVYIAEIKIDGDEMQKCVDKAVNRILYDAYQPLTEEDYTSLRERFGAEVEKTVREMAEGNANRWMI